MKVVIGAILVLTSGVMAADSATLSKAADPSTGSGQDWPTWGRTAERNMISEETGLPDFFDIASNQNVRWTFDLRGRGPSFSNPVVANGRVFLGTKFSKGLDPRFKAEGIFLCLDEESGERLWSLSIPNGAGNRPFGLTSTATVDGDRVYLLANSYDLLCMDVHGQTGGNRGSFVVEMEFQSGGKSNGPLTKQDGDILWKLNPGEVFGFGWADAYANSPLVFGKYVYCSTGYSWTGPGKPLNRLNEGKGGQPALMVVDKITGQLVATDNRETQFVFHGDWCTPSIGMINGKPQILFATPDSVGYAFEPEPERKDGEKMGLLKKIWWFDPYHDAAYWKHNGKKFCRPEIIAAPVCVNNRVYFNTGGDWNHPLYDHELFCVDGTRQGDVTQDGLLWKYIHQGSVSTVAIRDGLLYFGDFAGKLHCLDAETGKPCWVFPAKGKILQSPVVADGKVFFGTSTGEFYILRHGRTLQPPIFQTSLRAPMAGTPVIANRTLFIMTDAMVYAIATHHAAGSKP